MLSQGCFLLFRSRVSFTFSVHTRIFLLWALFFMCANVVFHTTHFLLQIITTPTKAHQLWPRQVPKLSPETGSFGSPHSQNSSRLGNDISNEPVPPEMSEQAFEAISEELRMVQVMFSFRKNNSHSFGKFSTLLSNVLCLWFSYMETDQFATRFRFQNWFVYMAQSRKEN